jgi:hypothetical protein
VKTNRTQHLRITNEYVSQSEKRRQWVELLEHSKEKTFFGRFDPSSQQTRKQRKFFLSSIVDGHPSQTKASTAVVVGKWIWFILGFFGHPSKAILYWCYP